MNLYFKYFASKMWNHSGLWRVGSGEHKFALWESELSNRSAITQISSQIMSLMRGWHGNFLGERWWNSVYCSFHNHKILFKFLKFSCFHHQLRLQCLIFGCRVSSHFQVNIFVLSWAGEVPLWVSHNISLTHTNSPSWGSCFPLPKQDR